MERPEWSGLEMHRALLVRIFPVFAIYSDWVFDSCFWSLTLTNARSTFDVSIVLQFLRPTTEGVLSTYHVYGHV